MSHLCVNLKILVTSIVMNLRVSIYLIMIKQLIRDVFKLMKHKLSTHVAVSM